MTKKLAFLGYGLRSKTMLQAFREIEADISVAAVADPRWVCAARRAVWRQNALLRRIV